MRRKAKELQQIRRDAERGKKGPGFGGFGSSGMSSSNTAIITDTLIEPEKPKPTPTPVRYGHSLSGVQRSVICIKKQSVIVMLFVLDPVVQVKHLNWLAREKKWMTLWTNSSQRERISFCLAQEKDPQMHQNRCHLQPTQRGNDPVLTKNAVLFIDALKVCW